ncbi:hypothetical protein [Kitasatospora sp. NPDC001175]|uniref:hypothetical protein n=1 Tax=Kitasatospora sp. NPDC001175 TaxID=3157103 RepID=UPI003CFC20C8
MQPTELQLQADALMVIAELADAAIEAGAPPIAPTWTIHGGLVSGHFRSADDTALRVLDRWRRALGAHRVGSYSAAGPEGPLTVWVVNGIVGEVSVRLTAAIPPAATTSRPADRQLVTA